jgi:O-Antigen ligase
MFLKGALSRYQDIFVYLYGAVVVIAAFPYGLVQTVPFTIISLVMFFLAIVAMFFFGKPNGAAHIFTATFVLFATLSIWIVFQTLQLPPALEPSHWQDAFAFAGARKASISVEPADTLNALLYLALPTMTFLTGLMATESDQRALTLLRILGVGAGIIALFGMFQFLLSPDKLIVIDKSAYLDSLTAVFVNRNTAATYLGLAFLVVATFASDYGRQLVGYSPNHAERPLNTVKFTFFCFLTATVLTALLLTQSRGGIFSTAIAAALYFPILVLNWMRDRRVISESTGQQKASRTILKVALLMGVAFIVVLPFAGRVILRTNMHGADDQRFCIWPGVVRGISENWLAGTGFGTFRTVFSQYRDPACGILWLFDRAHNSYLEGFLTLGIIFPVVLAVFLYVLGRCLWHGYRERNRFRQYAALGFAGTLLVAIHSLVDFSLQIPGFAIFFGGFLAGTVSICHGRDAKKRGKFEHPEMVVIAKS